MISDNQWRKKLNKGFDEAELGRLRLNTRRGGTDIVELTYEYDSNTNNIAEITYVHRDSNTVDYTYDNLDRLTLAEYSIDDSNEAFTIDDLGNRDSVNGRDGNNVDYAIDNLTSRYDSVGGNTLRYDAGGNLIR